MVDDFAYSVYVLLGLAHGHNIVFQNLLHHFPSHDDVSCGNCPLGLSEWHSRNISDGVLLGMYSSY